VEIGLGGIYALQRIMKDSPRDQPTVVAVLCAFVRDYVDAASARPSKSLPSRSRLTLLPHSLTMPLCTVGSNILPPAAGPVRSRLSPACWQVYHMPMSGRQGNGVHHPVSG
jgi:hypothetical protein